MMLPQDEIERLMDAALNQAQISLSLGEVPIGAIVAHNNQIISAAHNLVEQNKDPSAHAELIALREAGKILGDWRLNEAILCVTLEPCTMCAGAIKLARVGTVIFGVSDPRMGAMGSLFDLSQDSRIGPVPRVIRNIKEKDCSLILKNFFEGLRART